MKKSLMNKTKKGAASFYMVAFSTLILIIIVTSFAAVIISEVTRTANDDLSQSAYDSALAGVEDAKLLVQSYQKCINSDENSDSEWCGNIIKAVRNDDDDESDCGMVGRLLGRLEEGVVWIRESSVSNNMAQAYTCAEISLPPDYVGSTDSSMKVIKTKFDGEDVAKKVKEMRISWFSTEDLRNNNGLLNYGNFNEGEVVFGEKKATPPTISISMLQTANEFTLEDLVETKEGKTDRGTLFLVPTGDTSIASSSNEKETYLAGYSNDKGNYISKSAFVKSNDRTAKNLPYAVYCPPHNNESYQCTATIEIPDPIGEERNPDTFLFAVMFPQSTENIHFHMEFYCAEGVQCSEYDAVSEEDGSIETKPSSYAKLDGVQIKIDSTGRANDMYRRVEVRLEDETDYSLSLRGPLELTGENDNNLVFEKDLSVTSEHDF